MNQRKMHSQRGSWCSTKSWEAVASDPGLSEGPSGLKETATFSLGCQTNRPQSKKISSETLLQGQFSTMLSPTLSLSKCLSPQGMSSMGH